MTKIDFTKPLKLVTDLGYERPCWHLKGKETIVKDYPYVVVYEERQGNGPVYYEPVLVNDSGDVYEKHYFKIKNVK